MKCSTHLHFHYGLLEPRARHSLLPRILTPAPDALTVRRLLDSQLLSLLNRLLDWRIAVRRLNGQFVRFGDIGHGFGRVGGIGFVLVVGREGVGADSRDREGGAPEQLAGEARGDHGCGGWDVVCQSQPGA